MPESKLAEKLGFRIENGFFISPDETPPYKRIALRAEIALWNLCLELSERLAEHEKRWHLLQQPNRGIECATIIQPALAEKEKKA